jgi:hypothetical protein
MVLYGGHNVINSKVVCCARPWHPEVDAAAEITTSDEVSAGRTIAARPGISSA